MALDSSNLPVASGSAPGRYSFVRIGKGALEIQTETLMGPAPRFLSQVFFQGRLLLRQEEPLQRQGDMTLIWTDMQAVHRKVEKKVMERLRSLPSKRSEL